ncbi:hypothetical protein [Pseudalkalibacillus hwajinpoensis]|uniref:Peptidase MA-like domain-containing protein n=1 Tax=Guptibacillus hwajinpoensis TaxID=208199 RepID=A0A4U1MHQ2_9BACL|nr:hypothetical protein [Pseudalkalibacillus hwajinpoensis]TKD70839.1 hypothetical protein FBF83_09510 [Pseudalkalibacillus hwajinpoensis]
MFYKISKLFMITLFAFSPLLSFTPQASANTGSELETETYDHKIVERPTLPEVQTIDSTGEELGRVYAGDRGISDRHLKVTATILKNVTLPTIKKNMAYEDLKKSFPQLKNVPFKIILFSNERTYRNSLVKAGLPDESVDNIVNNTGGITDGTRIWIPLYVYNDKSQLAHYLTHELTHVLFQYSGLEGKSPIWFEEGLAVYNGFTAQQMVNPTSTRSSYHGLKKDLKEFKSKDGKFSLKSNQEDLLNASNNVEGLYFMAVKQLIKYDGLDGINQMIEELATTDIQSSFLTTYGITINEYESFFLKRANGSSYIADDSTTNNYDDTEIFNILFNPGYRVSW